MIVIISSPLLSSVSMFSFSNVTPNAVVVQAVDDYRKILRRLKRRPKDPTLEDQRRMLERFFCSGWFETLCDLDGRALIWKLRMEAGI